MLAGLRLPLAQPPLARTRRSAVLVQAKFPLVDELARDQMKKNIPKLSVGDTVKVGLTVNEGKGKTRTQRLNGTIIADDGANTNRTVTFRRIFQGIGVEMVMPVHAPAVQSFEVVRHGRVRRAKLYYLRERKGKAAKLKEVIQRKKPQ